MSAELLSSESPGAHDAGRDRSQLTSGLALGAVLALPAVVPAALRLARLPVPGPALVGWLALAGSAASMLGLVVASARVLRPLPGALYSAGLAALLALGPLTVFARLLWQGTHHRPLGAITFSFVATALLLGLLAFAARLRLFSGSERRVVRYLSRAAIWAGLIVSLLLSLPAALGAAADPSFRSGILDAGLLLVAAVLGSRIKLSARLERASRIFGPVLFLTLCAVAAALLSNAELRRALALVARVPLGPWAWIGVR